MINKEILLVEGRKGFITQAIVNRLEQKKYKVIRMSDDIGDITVHRNDADVIIYYAYGGDEHIMMVTRYLIELAVDLRKTVCVVGDPDDIAIAQSLPYSDKIYSYYERPFDLEILLEDMSEVFDTRSEYERKKSVLVVDDDPDFLKVITGWLKYDYKVEGVRSGEEALKYLNVTRPDIILLDYEMPEMDGYQVFDQIRKNPLTYRIPIIFLTGKNEKDSVMRILKKKPDGYLLKTTHKDELIDTLDRFFAESILEKH